MHPIKLENFYNENSGKAFPEYISLSNKEMADIYQKVLVKYGLNAFDRLTALLELRKLSKDTRYQNAQDEKFSFIELLSKLGIQSQENVFIDWHQLDDIDCLKLKDFNDYLSYIWYPGPDDLTIFDNSLDWIIFIMHDGFSTIIDLYSNIFIDGE